MPSSEADDLVGSDVINRHLQGFCPNSCLFFRASWGDFVNRVAANHTLHEVAQNLTKRREPMLILDARFEPAGDFCEATCGRDGDKLHWSVVAINIVSLRDFGKNMNIGKQ